MTKDSQSKKKNSNEQKKSRSSTMPEDSKEFITSIQKTCTSKKPKRTREEHGIACRVSFAMQSAKEIRKHRFEDIEGMCLHKSNNAMSVGRQQFHATTNFIRRFMTTKSKLMNHKDAVFEKALQKVDISDRERTFPMTHLQSISQTHSSPPSNEDTGCKSRR